MHVTETHLPSHPGCPWIPMPSPRAACGIPRSPAQQAQLIEGQTLGISTQINCLNHWVEHFWFAWKIVVRKNTPDWPDWPQELQQTRMLASFNLQGWRCRAVLFLHFFGRVLMMLMARNVSNITVFQTDLTSAHAPKHKLNSFSIICPPTQMWNQPSSWLSHWDTNAACIKHKQITLEKMSCEE